jgi:hypothetical protein
MEETSNLSGQNVETAISTPGEKEYPMKCIRRVRTLVVGGTVTVKVTCLVGNRG